MSPNSRVQIVEFLADLMLNAKIVNVVSAISFQWNFRGHSTEIVGINSPEPLEITATRINVAKESEVYKSKRSFSVYQSDNR